MESKQQAQQRGGLSPEIIQHYNKLKVEYSENFRTSMDLEEEKREHNLVIDAIKGLEQGRKAWRLVGGVLVEKTIGEVTTSLKENIEFLEKTQANYQTTLKQKENQLMEFENKHNLRPQRENIPKKEQLEEKKTSGVLA